MTEPVDQAARALAIDPSRSVIVQAPAGSGKTGLLVRRFLVLLGVVEQPEQILAITFTRKATAEMRGRVIGALRGVDETGNPETNPEMLALGRKALANDRARDWNLLAHSRRIRIQTIDSFCSELVRRMPWSARFGAPPELLEDASEQYLEAASLTLDLVEDRDEPELANACAALIELLDSNRAAARNLLAEMLKNRDKWMRKLADFDRTQIEGWWRDTIEQGLRHCDALLNPASRAELARLARYAAEQLAIRRQAKPTHPTSVVDDCLELQRFPAPDWQSVAIWRAIAALLLTKKGNPRAQITVREGFPPESPEKEPMQALLETLRENAELLRAWQRVAALPDGEISDRQWQDTEALLTLLPVAAAQLRVLFSSRNQADYTELSQRADYALGQAEAPSDLALALDYRLQHLLVDEFQDTSSGQIELLEKLLAGWTGEDGRSAFFVGDPMQSIYRFREAEVGIFLDAQDTGVGELRPESTVLECNFRSAPLLVNWFNDIFSQVMPTERDIIHGAVEYTPATAFREPEPGAIAQMHAGLERDRNAEAFEIVDVVAATLDSFAEGEIAILGRTRGSLGAIIAELDHRGIPFQGVRLQRLEERQAVQDLLAITLALLDPADRISWLSVLRGPWLGATLDELIALTATADTVSASDSAVTHAERIKKNIPAIPDCLAALGRVSEPRRDAFEAVARVMAEGLRQRPLQPLHVNVEACWLRLGAPALIAEVDIGNCRRFIQLLEKLEAQKDTVDHTNIGAAMADLYAESLGEAQVKVLTVHASKGLEFDTVILPDLHKPGRSDRPPLLRWKSFPDRILIAPRPSSAEDHSRGFDFLASLEKEHHRNEASRLLYVACTRAQKRLHLFASAGVDTSSKMPKLREPAETSLLSVLWPAVADVFEEAFAHYEEAESEMDTFTALSPGYPLCRPPVGWCVPEADAGLTQTRAAASIMESDALEFDWVRTTSRLTGIVIHQSLQEIELQGWAEWCKSPFIDRDRLLWRNRLVQHGVTGDLLEQAVANVELALGNTRSDNNAAWIFSDSHTERRTEWPLTGVVHGKVRHVVLDRSFIDQDGVRWIVDFKSSRHDNREDLQAFLEQERQRYRPTMDTYAAIVRDLEQCEVRTALYYPLLQQLVLL